MMRRATWSFVIDGGAIGVILMRGAQVPDGVVLLRYYLWQLEDVDPMAAGGYSVAFGFASSPSEFGTVSFFPPGAPSQIRSGENDSFHIGGAEPLQMTISGAPLTTGVLELSLETSRF